MTDPRRGAARAARAGALGFVGAALGVGGHVLARGPLPSAPIVFVLLLIEGCGSVLLTSRRCGFASLGGWMLATQIGLHEALMALSGGCLSMVGPPGSHLGHTAGAHLASCAGDQMSAMPMTSMSRPMLAAHIAAAVGATMLLAYGERLLWRLTEWVSALWRPLRSGTGLGSTPTRPISPLSVVVDSGRFLTGVVSRRGPPRRLALSAPLS